MTFDVQNQLIFRGSSHAIYRYNRYFIHRGTIESERCDRGAVNRRSRSRGRNSGNAAEFRARK